MGDTVFNFDSLYENRTNLFGLFKINFVTKNDLSLDLEKCVAKSNFETINFENYIMATLFLHEISSC
jgi:hypothetical protein